MFGVSKLVILAMAASLLTGGALVALTNGAGPGGGSDYGLDTDGDGAYDWLVVKMDLRVDEANYYNVWASLGTKEPVGQECYGPYPMDPTIPVRGEYGYPMDPPEDVLYPISWASVRHFLQAGEHTVAFAFKGTDIGFAGVDGPYTVHAQVYADGQWYDYTMKSPDGRPIPAPQGWTWTYTTRAHDADEFEEPTWAIRFTRVHEDRGEDVDGDGLHDYLVLAAQVQVNLAGTYSYDAFLSNPGDASREYWGFGIGDYGAVDLGAGPQTIEARFNGGDIWASGHSGAFDFRFNVYYGGAWIYDGIREGEAYPGQDSGDFDVYGDTLCGQTSEYRHEQFEERVEPATFTGVFADRGEDLDSDGLYDILAVDAEVDVTEANAFEFSGQLLSGDGQTWITADYQHLYLDVGVQTLTLRFSGPEIHRSGVDGSYRVDMNLIVAMRDPTATYTTTAYAHTDFDPDDQTGTRSHWIDSLTADASTIHVLVVRGNDLLAYVIEDVLTVEAYAEDGTVAFQARDKVYLPSGGDTQSFTFSWNPSPGAYVIVATLGDPAQPTDAVRIPITV